MHLVLPQMKNGRHKKYSTLLFSFNQKEEDTKELNVDSMKTKDRARHQATSFRYDTRLSHRYAVISQIKLISNKLISVKNIPNE